MFEHVLGCSVQRMPRERRAIEMSLGEENTIGGM